MSKQANKHSCFKSKFKLPPCFQFPLMYQNARKLEHEIHVSQTMPLKLWRISSVFKVMMALYVKICVSIINLILRGEIGAEERCFETDVQQTKLAQSFLALALMYLFQNGTWCTLMSIQNVKQAKQYHSVVFYETFQHLLFKFMRLQYLPCYHMNYGKVRHFHIKIHQFVLWIVNLFHGQW